MRGAGRDLAFLAFLALIFAGPLAVLTAYAFGSVWAFPDLWPRRFDLRAATYVLSQARELGASLASSVGYSLATALAAFVLCLAPARVLARQSFAGKHLIEGLLLAPALVPSMTFALGAQTLLIRLGLSDTWPGVVAMLTAMSYPYMLRALIAGHQSFDPAYAACAMNLGAGRLRTLISVELPLILPAALAGGTVVFLVAFSEYFLVFLVGGGAVPSFAGALFPLLTSSSHSVAALLTLVFLAVPLVLFAAIELFVRRKYRRMGL